MITEFLYNEVPVLNGEHLTLVQRLRNETISVMRNYYPDAYARDNTNGEYRYTTKRKPSIKGNVESLLKDLNGIFTEEIVSQLEIFERDLRPSLENNGFEMILRHILPSVMDIGPRSDVARISVRGTCRCMDCFEDKQKHKKDSSGVGYFKLHQNRSISVGISPIEYIINNWRDLLPTDVRLEEDRELMQKFTPRYCLAQKTPNYKHQDIILLSTVIVLEYWDREKGERVRNSNVLHMRDKSGPEMLRKLMLYFIGQIDEIPDGIGSRSIVPKESFAKVLVRTINQYPYRGPLNGAIFATNYQDQNFKNLEGRGNLAPDEETLLKIYLRQIIVEDKDRLIIDNKTKEKARDIKMMGRFESEGSISSSNILQHMFYTDDMYTKMNGVHGLDAFDYQLRRFRGAHEYYTTGHWMVYLLLKDTIYHKAFRQYVEKVARDGLKKAIVSDRISAI